MANPTIQIRKLSPEFLDHLQALTGASTYSGAVTLAATAYETFLSDIDELASEVGVLTLELKQARAQIEKLRSAAYEILQTVDQKELL